MVTAEDHRELEQLWWAYNDRPRLSSSTPGMGVRAASPGLGAIKPSNAGWITDLLWKNELAPKMSERFGFGLTPQGGALVYRMVRKPQQSRPGFGHAVILPAGWTWDQVADLILADGVWRGDEGDLESSATRIATVGVTHRPRQKVLDALRDRFVRSGGTVEHLAPVIYYFLAGAPSLVVTGEIEAASFALLSAVVALGSSMPLPIHQLMLHAPSGELGSIRGTANGQFAAGAAPGSVQTHWVQVPSPTVDADRIVQKVALEIADAFVAGGLERSAAYQEVAALDTYGENVVPLRLGLNRKDAKELLPQLQRAPGEIRVLSPARRREIVELAASPSQAAKSAQLLAKSVELDPKLATLLEQGWDKDVRAMLGDHTIPTDRIQEFSCAIGAAIPAVVRGGHDALARQAHLFSVDGHFRLLEYLYLFDADDDLGPVSKQARGSALVVSWPKLGGLIEALPPNWEQFVFPILNASLMHGKVGGTPAAELTGRPSTRTKVLDALVGLAEQLQPSQAEERALAFLVTERSEDLPLLLADLLAVGSTNEQALWAERLVTGMIRRAGYEASQIVSIDERLIAAGREAILSRYWLRQFAPNPTVEVFLWTHNPAALESFSDDGVFEAFTRVLDDHSQNVPVQLDVLSRALRDDRSDLRAIASQTTIDRLHALLLQETPAGSLPVGLNWAYRELSAHPEYREIETSWAAGLAPVQRPFLDTRASNVGLEIEALRTDPWSDFMETTTLPDASTHDEDTLFIRAFNATDQDVGNEIRRLILANPRATGCFRRLIASGKLKVEHNDRLMMIIGSSEHLADLAANTLIEAEVAIAEATINDIAETHPEVLEYLREPEPDPPPDEVQPTDSTTSEQASGGSHGDAGDQGGASIEGDAGVDGDAETQSEAGLEGDAGFPAPPTDGSTSEETEPPEPSETDRWFRKGKNKPRAASPSAPPRQGSATGHTVLEGDDDNRGDGGPDADDDDQCEESADEELAAASDQPDEQSDEPRRLRVFEVCLLAVGAAVSLGIGYLLGQRRMVWWTLGVYLALCGVVLIARWVRAMASSVDPAPRTRAWFGLPDDVEVYSIAIIAVMMSLGRSLDDQPLLILIVLALSLLAAPTFLLWRKTAVDE